MATAVVMLQLHRFVQPQNLRKGAPSILLLAILLRAAAKLCISRRKKAVLGGEAPSPLVDQQDDAAEKPKTELPE